MSSGGSHDLTTSALPQELQIDAMHGWRYAKLKTTGAKDQSVGLFSLNDQCNKKPLVAEADAECKIEVFRPNARRILGTYHIDPHPKDQVPEITCTCGFYAMKNAADLAQALHRYEDYVLLEVKLSGKIIEGTNGYRAEHQTIICAWMLPACEIGSQTTGFLCDAPSAYVHFSNGTESMESFLWRPLCEEHAHDFTHKMTLAELTNHTGIEFRWNSWDSQMAALQKYSKYAG